MTSEPTLPAPNALARHWRHDPSVVFLNHGSFGSCPSLVLQAQSLWRDRMEAELVRFHLCELDPAMDAARDRVAAMVGAESAGVVWAPNATQAVAEVLHNVRLEPGDELLVNTHEYPACLTMFERACRESGARLVRAELPFPVHAEDEITEAIVACVTPRTRLALLSLTTSPTALVLPVRTIIRELRERGVETLLDAAHGPGFVEMDVAGWGAAYTCGNLHKWVCAPKGAAFLHVREDLRDGFEPHALSARASHIRPDRSRYHLLFDYVGTDDPSAWLATPAAIDFMASLDAGGWPGVIARNKALALRGRDILCDALGVEPAAPDSMLSAMAAVPIPAPIPDVIPGPGYPDPLWRALVERWSIQVPIFRLGTHTRGVRIAAQLYNSEAQFEYLAHALRSELTR